MENNVKINDNQLLMEKNFYTCNQCNKTPKILNIDYKNNNIQFNCNEHKINTLTIKDFLNSILDKDKCQNCFKKNDNSFVLKFCLDCNIIFCDKCIMKHLDYYPNHKIINNEDYNIRCKKHLNEFYVGYCITCNEKICNECKKTRIHKSHQKYDHIEILPNEKDLNIINNFNNMIKDELINYQNKVNLQAIEEEKNNEINIIIEKYKNLNENIEKKYNEIIQQFLEKNIKKKEEEITKNIEKENEDIIITQFKYENKKKEYEENNQFYIDNHINIIKLNNILVNSYKKQKDNNLNYIENISKIVESINQYNQKQTVTNLKMIKEKYELILDPEGTCLKVKNDNINNEISNIIFQYPFNNLKEINISSKSLTSIDFITKNNFEKLEKLLIMGCPINNINNLYNKAFNNLIELKLSKCILTDFSAISGQNFSNLKVLDLSYNNIKDINILKDSKFNKNLQELYLNNNKINDISVFNNNIFNKLITLFLSNNSIENISSLKFILKNNCKNLTLDNNVINNINLFKEINDFFSLRNVSISNNPINFNIEENYKVIQIINNKKNIRFYYQ